MRVVVVSSPARRSPSTAAAVHGHPLAIHGTIVIHSPSTIAVHARRDDVFDIIMNHAREVRELDARALRSLTYKTAAIIASS